MLSRDKNLLSQQILNNPLKKGLNVFKATKTFFFVGFPDTHMCVYSLMNHKTKINDNDVNSFNFNNTNVKFNTQQSDASKSQSTNGTRRKYGM